jgi:heme exporter protein A
MVGDLSAGQKRRLMLARLLIAPRPIWLLDEPLTALDTQGRDLIETLAGYHLQCGGLILAASHEALNFATHQLTLKRNHHAMVAL